MTHDETIGWLPDLVEGCLPEAQRVVVARHVEGCEECRSIALGYRVIARALREEAAVSPRAHPDSETLVAFATGLGTLAPAESAKVARHLEECAACAADAGATRLAESFARAQDAREAPVAPRVARPRFVVYLAAAALAGVVVGYSGHLVAPNRSNPVSPGDIGGAFALPVLSGALRGGAQEAPAVVVTPGQPFVAFSLALPQETELPAGALALELIAASGDATWRQSIDAARLSALSTASGTILVVVPSSAAAPGSYVLRLSRAGAAAAPLLEAPLRFVR